MEIETVKLRTPFPNPDKTYVYIINSEIMIDGGFCSPESAEKLEEFKVKRRIITHHHIDHVGIIFYGSRSAEIHSKELEYLEIYWNPEKFVEDYKKLFKLYGVNERYAETLGVIGAMKLGKPRVENLKNEGVVKTPGHTAGHISVLIDGCLFSGDFVLSDTTPNISFYPSYTSGVSDYINSLRRVLQLEVSEIFPAHERRIKNPEKRIHELLEHCKSRAEEVYDAVNSGKAMVEEIAAEISWSCGSYRNFDDFNRFMAVCETLAFAHYLKELGRIKETPKDGKIFFSVASSISK